MYLYMKMMSYILARLMHDFGNVYMDVCLHELCTRKDYLVYHIQGHM